VLRVFICLALLYGPQVVKARPLTVVYASAWTPISIGEGKTVKGLLPSLVETILHREMGVKIQHVGVPWKRAQRMVKTGQADAFVTAPTQARLEYSESTEEAFYTLEFRAFARKNSDSFQLLTKNTDLSQIKDRVRFCDVLGNGWARSFYGSQGINYFIAPDWSVCANDCSQ